MGVSIYAAITETYEYNGKTSQCLSPVIPFANWEQEITIYPDDDDWESEIIRTPNPDYVPDAGMDLSCANADALFAALGLPLADGPSRFAIDEVVTAAVRWQAKADFVASAEIPASVSTGARGATIIDCGRREGYLNEKVAMLHRLAVEGRKLGATWLCAA